jgi:hypothetical protein
LKIYIVNLRTNNYGRTAANELMRSASSLNFAKSGNLASSRDLHNRSRADWVAENYNYDPDEFKPPTNYQMNRKKIIANLIYRWIKNFS